MALRICFIGDSITTGTGDHTMLGWPGRICAAACSRGHDVTLYNLGVRGETSQDIKRRWRAEAAPRMLAGMNCAMVFAFGLNDCVLVDDAKLRVEPEQTAINARAVLTEATAWLPSLFIGPAPVDDTRSPPLLIAGKKIRIQNIQIAEANQVLARVMAEIDVPYLDVFTQLTENPQWHELMKQGDGVHPPGQGYDLLAQSILNWEPWCRLLGQPSIR